MSDILNHECGIAFVRILKPHKHFEEKYGSMLWAVKRFYLLMEKQRNRGQEGAGVVGVKLEMPHGYKYIERVRSNDSNPIQDVFKQINGHLQKINNNTSEDTAKLETPFLSEIYLGHLRYSTFGNNSIDLVHPLKRSSNWRSRNLVLAANFNLTNVDELFNSLINSGQHPRDYSDTVTLLEKVGYYQDREIQSKFDLYKEQGLSKPEISEKIESSIDIKSILSKSTADWDGGYVVAGVMGHGDSFILRDPWGIRPAFFYKDEEVVVVASEASVIRTAFSVDDTNIKEIKPGYALIIKKDGTIGEELIREPKIRSSCSFERIYFSRGNDRNIYRERKKLGELISKKVISVLNGDLENSVFTYIPNTAEVSFYGMIQGIRHYMSEEKRRVIREANGNLTDDLLEQLILKEPRIEKIVIKDAKLRTFITTDNERDEMVGHVYDVTYGAVSENDNLVVIDDSIVRGTTLSKSILRILDTLNPKRIVIVSSAPQIRYPDCYGIDMTKMGEFIAFNAAISMLKERNREDLIEDIYKKCKSQSSLPKEKIKNYVKEIYDSFTTVEISDKIAELVKGNHIKSDIKIVFQSVEDLHLACKENSGDWYFTGNYPTPGGNKVVNTSFINWYEGVDKRSY